MFKSKFLFLLAASLFGLIATQTANIDELCALAPKSIILQPKSCSNWLKCPSAPGAADWEEGSCVFNLYFNKNTGKCEYEDNVECPFEDRAKNRCAREAEGTFMEDLEQCNAYIYCSGGEEIKSYCPSNLVFDAVNKACVYKTEYKCSETKPHNKSDPLCMSLPDGMFFADKQDCTKYSQCRNGVVRSHTCNSSFAWDYVQGICLPVEDTECFPSAKKPEPELKVCVDRVGPMADGISCSGYYFCKKMANGTYDRKPEHFTCSSGTFYDINTLSCRDRLNVKCSLDRCEGMGNKYVNVAGDCRSYVLCENGVATTKGMCPNEHYFDERTQGCTPQVVSYAACSA